MEGFETFTDFIPGLIIHAVLMFLGMVSIGAGQRARQPAAAATE
jgi:hypothetical protein